MPDMSDTSETRATRVRHKCYTSDTSATRVKNFDFDSDTSKNIFLHPYIYYMASETLQGEKQFQNAFKKCTTKTKLFNEKAISKSFTLECSCKYHCTFPHNYAQ